MDRTVILRQSGPRVRRIASHVPSACDAARFAGSSQAGATWDRRR